MGSAPNNIALYGRNIIQRQHTICGILQYALFDCVLLLVVIFLAVSE